MSGLKKHVNMLQFACLINLSLLEGINMMDLKPVGSFFHAFKIIKFVAQQCFSLIFVVQNPS